MIFLNRKTKKSSDEADSLPRIHLQFFCNLVDLGERLRFFHLPQFSANPNIFSGNTNHTPDHS